MSRPGRPDPGEEAVPGSGHTGALPFLSVRAMIVAAVAEHMHLLGFTYSPKSDLVYCVKSRHDGLALFRELVRGNKDFRADLPVYLIALTHHASTEVDHVVKAGYEGVSERSNQPLIGFWTNPKGVSYLDAVLPAQFIKEEEAVCLGKEYGQQTIIRIKPDGHHKHIGTDQEHVRPRL